MGEQETIKYENLKTTPKRELLEYCKVEMWLAGWTGCWAHLKREAASRKTEPVKIVNTQGNKDLESERKRVDSFSAHPSDSLDVHTEMGVREHSRTFWLRTYRTDGGQHSWEPSLGISVTEQGCKGSKMLMRLRGRWYTEQWKLHRSFFQIIAEANSKMASLVWKKE